MNEEQKEVYEALQCDEDNLYEELNDDFVLEANDGIIPMKIKNNHKEKEKTEKEFQKLLKDEYDDKNDNSDFIQSNKLSMKDFKDIIKKDIKELNVKVKNKKETTELVVPEDKKKEENKNFENSELTNKQNNISSNINEEVNPEEMSLMELETYYKKENKKFEVLEKKTTRMKAGGMIIFKKVRKRKPEEIKRLQQEQQNEFNEIEMMKESTEDINEEEEIKEVKYTINKEKAKSHDSDMSLDESDNEFQDDYQDGFFEEDRLHEEKMNTKDENDEFIKNIDRMLMNGEVTGLTSSEDESIVNQITKKSEIKKANIEQLEKEYQNQQKLLKNQNKFNEDIIFRPKKNKKIQKELLLEKEREDEQKIKDNNYIVSKDLDLDLEVLPNKELRKQKEQEELNEQGFTEFLKNKGKLSVEKIKKIVQIQTEKEEKEKIPTMKEYFGESVYEEDVGECENAPQEREVHENIYCMQVIKENSDIKAKPKEKKNYFENNSDFEEVEREDIAKKLQRKKKETKEERKLRKQKIKDEKNKRKEKKRNFKEKILFAKKERQKQENIEIEKGIMKGIPSYRIN